MSQAYVTYGGVPLTFATPEVMAWLNANTPLEQMSLFEDRVEYLPRSLFPAAYTTIPTLSYTSAMLNRPPRLHTLFWPVGARRFAVSSWIVTDRILNLLQPLVFGTDNTVYNALPLVLCDGTNTISASLYMLPPVPLQQIEGTNGLYLLTLVDARYLWARDTSGINQSYSKTWAEFFSSTPAGTVAVDTIPSAYNIYVPTFTGAYYIYFTPLSFFFDTVCLTIGQRFVRNLDGSLRSMAADTSQAIVTTNLSLGTRRNGGLLAFPNYLSGLVPSQLTFVVPDQRSAPPAPVYAQSVTLASLALPMFATIAGGGTRVFYDNYPLNDANSADLTALLTQISTDWYNYQLGAVHATFNNLVPWVPEGLHDIEWQLSPHDCSTTVKRQPFLTHECMLMNGGF